MQTEQHRTPPPGPARDAEARKAPESTPGEEAAADWRPRKDLMNQMLAYRDWWNMPVRRAVRRTPRKHSRPADRG